jgi:hypothetical protein
LLRAKHASRVARDHLREELEVFARRQQQSAGLLEQFGCLAKISRLLERSQGGETYVQTRQSSLRPELLKWKQGRKGDVQEGFVAKLVPEGIGGVRTAWGKEQAEADEGGIELYPEISSTPFRTGSLIKEEPTQCSPSAIDCVALASNKVEFKKLRVLPNSSVVLALMAASPSFSISLNRLATNDRIRLR